MSTLATLMGKDHEGFIRRWDDDEKKQRHHQRYTMIQLIHPTLQVS
jgi:hypothetical protein